MIDAICVTEAPLVSLYINYPGLFSFSIMKYMVFGYGVYGIWILFGYNIYLVALHHVALQLELCCNPKVATVPVQHRLLGITMQLHTLLGMKAGVHMHLYAFLYGWGLDVIKYIAIYYEKLCLTLCYGLLNFGYTICDLYGYLDFGLM